MTVITRPRGPMQAELRWRGRPIRRLGRHLCVGIMLPAAVGLALLVAPKPVLAGPSIRIIALGDSLTAGYGLARRHAFPRRLQRALKAKGYHVRIVNAGVSGDTASGGLARLGWAVGKGADAVILELGANDMLRGIDPAVTRKALNAIITRLKARGIEVLLAGMQPMAGLGEPYIRTFAHLYEDLAKKHHLLFYPFFLDGVALDRRFNQRDGLHPNARGVRAIVARILPHVEKLIERVRARKGKKKRAEKPSTR